MKTLIFQLFIFFSIIFNSFAAKYDDILHQPAQPPRTNSAGLLVLTEADFETNAPSLTTNLSPEFVWLAEDPVVAKKPLRAVFLDEEPVATTGNPTNALMPWEMNWSVLNKALEETTVTQISGQGYTWVDEEPVVAAENPTNTPRVSLIPLNYDPFDYIPPPITNDFNVIFPKLYTTDNDLVMTNAQYSGRNRRTLSFSRFTPTGLESLSLDVTKVHPVILQYLNISRDRVIREDKEIKRRQVQRAIDKIAQKTTKLKIQIDSLYTIADATVQEDAIIAAIDAIDVIDKIYDAMDATLNTMDVTDQIQPNSAESETITAMFATVKWALDSMTAIHRERAKQDAEMNKQRQLMSYQEYLRGRNEQEAIKASRPTSMEVNTTEEYIDRWGNRYTRPKSSVVNFNYDK